MSLDHLLELAAGAYAAEAVEAAKVTLVHDLVVGLSARALVQDLVEPPENLHGRCTDLLSGGRVDPYSAVSRNAQLIHALTQDETHLSVMTHVGATSIPLLLALAEEHGTTTRDLAHGFAAAIAAAEALGWGVSPQMPARGIRPTSVIGPVAAVIGAGRMLDWPAARVQRAVGKVTAVAFGTQQPWVEGSQEWLFQVSAAGLTALAAARSSVGPWVAAEDPHWGKAGAFTALGLQRPVSDSPRPDHRLAATRVSLKRFAACATNQVPMSLLQDAVGRARGDGRRVVSVSTLLAPALATYPGADRTTGLSTWSARLMSLPYCLAVVAESGTFAVEDLRRQPVSVSDSSIRAMAVVADPSKEVGDYALQIVLDDGQAVDVSATSSTFGRPERPELDFAARTIAGTATVDAALSVLDREGSTVTAFVESLVGDHRAR